MCESILVDLFQISYAKERMNVIRRLTNNSTNLIALRFCHTLAYVIFVSFVAK